MTVTLDCGARNIYFYFVHVVAYTGSNTSTPTGATATDSATVTNGAESLTLSAAPASDSEVIAARLLEASGAGTVLAAEGSGWTEVYDSSADDEYGLESQIRTGSTSTDVPWVDIQNGTATIARGVALALEIMAAAGGATVPQFMPSVWHLMGSGGMVGVLWR